ncbi:hypothetical protein CDL12_29432 [Handroanthus impetiginosus]|uniref:CUE domain-containing protein n=1 Tax=Handroanthus impetiginosus TaxID=429701 RepID=A0A2G9FYG0_9LAMI|nr:hypothetical protein CDL12_29432 [Handroanthus impetiginosus]
MKKGSSSLNPHAASYIPLSKRGAADENKYSNTAKELQDGRESVWYGRQPDNALTHGQQRNISDNYVHNAGALQTADTKWKDNHASEFHASSSHYPNEIPDTSNYNQEFMDLAYLQINFPGISEDSLSDVYLASRCDLDAAVDMLNQLELYPDDLSDKLPDTLDIGDVPEPQELRKSTAQAGASTSGPSKSSSTN